MATYPTTDDYRRLEILCWRAQCQGYWLTKPAAPFVSVREPVSCVGLHELPR